MRKGKDARQYALRLLVLLEKVSLAVLICSVTRSEAEGRDSGTFSLCCVQREPHQSASASVPKGETLGSLKKAEARRATQGSECTSIRESRCFRVALQCLSSGGLFERVRELRYTRRQRLRMALVVGNVQIRDWERLVRNARH